MACASLRACTAAILPLMLATVSVQAADLLDLYQRAKDSDPVFLSAQYAYESARQKVPQAFSALLPAVSANATSGRNPR